MKKLFLSVIGMYLGILAAFSQGSLPEDSSYKKRKLSFEEANIVSSYYTQDGNNAAVTGGIGTQKLTDISNAIDVKLHMYDKHLRKHTFTGEIGIDHYTSASSDKIDPNTISSASSADTRYYPSLSWTMENEEKGRSIGAGISYSGEYDYQSFGANINFSKKTRDKNGEFSAKFQAFMDQVSLIYPKELRAVLNPNNNNNNPNPGEDQEDQEDEDDDDDYSMTARNTFSGSLSWSQIINQQFQLMLTGELVYQTGYLGLPFHRVYFADNSVHVENLPGTRMKIPIGLRASYFIGDKYILRAWLRNYHDDWGISSNAMQLETVVKINPFFSVTPFYRYYQQTAADYFAPYGIHTIADKYYNSNYDLSKFNSNFYGAGIRLAPPEGIFKMQHFKSFELRYGHYQKSNGMNANIISLNMSIK